MLPRAHASGRRGGEPGREWVRPVPVVGSGSAARCGVSRGTGALESAAVRRNTGGAAGVGTNAALVGSGRRWQARRWNADRVVAVRDMVGAKCQPGQVVVWLCGGACLVWRQGNRR